MDFSYRYSRLKKFNPKKRPIILSAVLQLSKGDKKELKKIIKEKFKIRLGRYPTAPSAGCIFQNPSEYSAGFLIEQCGLKGKKIGGAQISKKHANFIINKNNATAKDVLKLIDLIKKEVKNKFNVKLKEEVQCIGF